MVRSNRHGYSHQTRVSTQSRGSFTQQCPAHTGAQVESVGVRRLLGAGWELSKSRSVREASQYEPILARVNDGDRDS
jgi:hypothetical protein